jgi:hypothetical protein
VIHGLGIFGPVIFNLVHELTFNSLLLFHHIVHIPKYPLLEIKTLMIWAISCGYHVSCFRFVNGGVSMSTTFKLGNTNIYGVLPWVIGTLILFGNEGVSRLAN